MKRDWNKINFWMMLFTLFLMVTIVTVGWLYIKAQEFNFELDYQCSIRGLDAYNKNGFECIGTDKAVYDIPVESAPGFIMFIVVILIAGSLLGGISSLGIVYREYNRGD